MMDQGNLFDSADSVNPEMVEIARTARGLTQGELAKAVGISQAKLSKFENGVAAIDPETLEKISDVLRFPVEFFHFRAPAHGLGLSVLFHRRRASAQAGEIRQTGAVVNALAAHLRPLLKAAEFSMERHIPKLNPDRLKEGAREAARLVRGGWGMPAGPVKNLVGLIEAAGGIVFDVELPTNRIDAIYHNPPDLPPLFFVNRSSPPDRRRFSLAHELGHCVMHSVPNEEMEEQADEFASEFLMPSPDIENDLANVTLPRLAMLKAHWKTSMSSLIERAAQLSLITPRKREWLHTQMSKQGWRKTEPVELPHEHPATLRRLIEFHLTNLGYSFPELCRTMGAFDEDVREIFSVAPTTGWRIVG